MSELKPCPFCGGQAEIMNGLTEDGIITFSVVCQKCHIGIFRARSKEWDTWPFMQVDDIFETWNRRANNGV